MILLHLPTQMRFLIGGERVTYSGLISLTPWGNNNLHFGLAHKPRLQGNRGIFETSLQCRHHIAKIFPVALDMDERSVRV